MGSRKFTPEHLYLSAGSCLHLTAMSKPNPSLTPKSKERNLHTIQKQTQNVIASSKSYQKWNDEFKKFNKRETEKERSKESWRC
jgi:dihydroorotase-like cyclic amidohydrolase